MLFSIVPAPAFADVLEKSFPDVSATGYIVADAEGFYEFFLLELGTGMRRGEMLGLMWDDLNFRTGELHVCRQVCAVDGKLEISVPKTKSSVRTIVLPPSLVEVLKEYKKTVDSGWMFPSPQNPDSPR